MLPHQIVINAWSDGRPVCEQARNSAQHGRDQHRHRVQIGGATRQTKPLCFDDRGTPTTEGINNRDRLCSNGAGNLSSDLLKKRMIFVGVERGEPRNQVKKPIPFKFGKFFGEMLPRIVNEGRK